jgi:hypothetical protein
MNSAGSRKKTRIRKNAWKCSAIPTAQCTMCLAALFFFSPRIISNYWILLWVGNPKEHSILKCFRSFTFFNILEKHTLRMI